MAASIGFRYILVGDDWKVIYLNKNSAIKAYKALIINGEEVRLLYKEVWL